MNKKLSTSLAVMALCGVFYLSGAQITSANTYIQSYAMAITRNLTLGSSGADVASLQGYLAQQGYIHFSPGYFDQATRAAVIQFQLQNGIPATGFFGPISRGIYNRLIGATNYNNPYQYNYNQYTPFPTTDNCPSGFYPTYTQGLTVCVKQAYGNYNNYYNYNDNNYSHNYTNDLNGGTADLTNFRVYEGNDSTLSSGDNNAEIMQIRFDVKDGDVQLSRAYINFEFRGNSSAENKPWQVFNNARLLSDGNEIATMNTDNKSDWEKIDANTYQLRFTGLDEIIREGDKANITLEVDVNDNVDSNKDLWKLYVPDNGIRAVDSDKVGQEIGNDNDTINVDINGDNNNNSNATLSISSSDEDPNNSDINVYSDRVSSMKTVFAFDIKARGQDVDLTKIPLTLTFLDNGSYNAMINDAELSIDGETFSDFTVENGSDDTATLTFNLHNNATIHEGDTATAQLRLQFKQANGNYHDNDRIRATITSSNVDDIVARDEDSNNLDSSDLSGSASGETHALNVN